MAVGLPLKTTYANGDVYSASDVNDTNGTVNLFTSSTLSQAGGKNCIINGGMDIWQRGTTFNSSTSFTADRWVVFPAAGTLNVTRSTDVPTSPYFTYSLQIAGVSSSGDILRQRIESAQVTSFAGQTVTLSIYAKSTAGTAPLKWNTQVPSVTDNFTTVVQDQSGTFSASPSGSWTRYTATFTVSANAVRGYELRIFRDSSASSNTTLITGVQIELGATATTFSRAAGNIQGELAACQRYYEKSYSQATSPGTATQTGMTVFQNNNSAAGALRITSFFKTTKRTSPNVRLYDGAGTIDKVMYNYTNGYTGTAVPNETSVDVYTDGVTTKNALSYQFTADAEL